MNEIELDITSEGYRLTLTGRLDVFEAAAVLNATREAAHSGQPISIHIDGLDCLDTAILQILLALQQEARRRGQCLQMIGGSPEIRRICLLLGGHRHLFSADFASET